MKKLLLLLAALAAGTLSLKAVATEEPAFALVERDGSFEIRDYPSLTIAETVVAESFDDAGNTAFRPLFRYISGSNREKQKIAMTAPVLQQTEADGRFRVGFIAPASYSLASAPRPQDPDVQLREIPARRYAVVRYSGRWTEKNFRAHERQLREWITSRALVPEGPVLYARYNAPFVPWPMRRNEVMIAVTGR